MKSSHRNVGTIDSKNLSQLWSEHVLSMCYSTSPLINTPSNTRTEKTDMCTWYRIHINFFHQTRLYSEQFYMVSWIYRQIEGSQILPCGDIMNSLYMYLGQLRVQCSQVEIYHFYVDYTNIWWNIYVLFMFCLCIIYVYRWEVIAHLWCYQKKRLIIHFLEQERG